MRDLPNLDFLRSTAVLLVVSSHLLFYTGHIRPGVASFWFLGMLGVFLFFTHTTLVLMWSLQRDPHPLRFYVRRIFRIYPLWLVVLALSVLVQLPTSPAFAPGFGFLHVGIGELLANATLTFNIVSGCRLIGASWSLPVEVQMYVVLPALFFFIRAYPRLWPLLLLDAVAGANAFRQDVATGTSLLFCTPLFLPGAMAYIGYRQRRPVLPAWTFPVALLSCIGGFNLWASARQSSYRSGWIFALTIGLSLPFFRQLSWAPLTRAAHLVARYSYGIYLCHFAAIAVAVHFLRGHGIVLRTAAFVFVLTSLSVAFYHLVEKPMIRVGSRLAGRLEHGPEPPMNEANLSLEPAP